MRGDYSRLIYLEFGDKQGGWFVEKHAKLQRWSLVMSGIWRLPKASESRLGMKVQHHDVKNSLRGEKLE